MKCIKLNRFSDTKSVKEVNKLFTNYENPEKSKHKQQTAGRNRVLGDKSSSEMFNLHFMLRNILGGFSFR